MTQDIALSIAHHEAAQGASHEGVTEYKLSTKWVQAIAMYSTRIFVPEPGRLPAKVKEINDKDVSIACELHFNAAPGSGATGCETLYYPGSGRGKSIAQIVQTGLMKFLNTKDRGVKEGWYLMDKPGYVDYMGDVEGDEQPDYFLRKTRMPSLILEPLFIEEAVDNNVNIEVFAATFASVLELASDQT